MKADRAYLERVANDLRKEGITVTSELARGNPPQQILHTAVAKECDLIAMTSHGHKWVGDLLLGSTIEKVRHNTTIPLLIVRAQL
jgi:manganese transport protein